MDSASSQRIPSPVRFLYEGLTLTVSTEATQELLRNGTVDRTQTAAHDVLGSDSTTNGSPAAEASSSGNARKKGKKAAVPQKTPPTHTAKGSAQQFKIATLSPLQARIEAKREQGADASELNFLDSLVRRTQNALTKGKLSSLKEGLEKEFPALKHSVTETSANTPSTPDFVAQLERIGTAKKAAAIEEETATVLPPPVQAEEPVLLDFTVADEPREEDPTTKKSELEVHAELRRSVEQALDTLGSPSTNGNGVSAPTPEEQAMKEEVPAYRPLEDEAIGVPPQGLQAIELVRAPSSSRLDKESAAEETFDPLVERAIDEALRGPESREGSGEEREPLLTPQQRQASEEDLLGFSIQEKDNGAGIGLSLLDARLEARVETEAPTVTPLRATLVDLRTPSTPTEQKTVASAYTPGTPVNPVLKGLRTPNKPATIIQKPASKKGFFGKVGSGIKWTWNHSLGAVLSFVWRHKGKIVVIAGLATVAWKEYNERRNKAQ